MVRPVSSTIPASTGGLRSHRGRSLREAESAFRGAWHTIHSTTGRRSGCWSAPYSKHSEGPAPPTRLAEPCGSTEPEAVPPTRQDGRGPHRASADYRGDALEGPRSAVHPAVG